MACKLVNLLGRKVWLADWGNIKRVLPSGSNWQGKISIKEVTEVGLGDLKIPVNQVVLAEDGQPLPPPKAGTLYLVEESVARAARDRKDLVFPARVDAYHYNNALVVRELRFP